MLGICEQLPECLTRPRDKRPISIYTRGAMIEKRWSCDFQAQSGGRASATFDSPEQAREFANRHARIIQADGEWTVEADDSWLLRTQTVAYRVIRL